MSQEKKHSVQFDIHTGNPVVDAVGTIHFSGNIIPEAWYYTIVNEKKEPNLIAILLLAEICYWYRPSEIRDEATGAVSYKKKFADKDYLQKNYSQLCKKFNISTKQCRAALILLEQLGVAKRIFRTVKTEYVTNSNVMYISLDPERLMQLTFPDKMGNSVPRQGGVTHQGNVAQQGNTYFPTGKHPLPEEETPPSLDGNTYTKTTDTKTTTENTTAVTAAVAEATRLFEPLHLPDTDVIAIVEASGYDLSRCKNVLSLLEQQTRSIHNVTGWLISALRNGYAHVGKEASQGTVKTNLFNEFPQHEYDFDMLEKELCG